MRHASDYGPYKDMKNRYFFQHLMYSGLLACSNGPGLTQVGISSIYSISAIMPTGKNVVYEWTVEDAKGEDAIGTKANVSIDGTTAIISFNNTGIYEIYFRCYLVNGGSTLATYSFEAIVL